MKLKLKETLAKILSAIASKLDKQYIAAGTITITQTSLQTAFSIDFGKTFPSVPTVLLTCEDTDGIFWSLWLYSVTKTGCSANSYWSGYNGNRTLKVHWLAIVGGVLRNTVISRLTAIFTSLLFGGDVDEAVIETTAKEVDTRTNKDTKECVRLCGVHRPENGYADRRWNGQQSAGHKRWENSTILHADTLSITISERRWAA